MLQNSYEAIKRARGRLAECNPEIPRVFCWTKMGTEAGQSLDTILRRKELERRAGNGVFAWGIGNSLGTSAELARNQSPGREVEVLFTPMKSAPKSVDVTPSSLLLWLAYLGDNGNLVDLPRHMFVTSRGGIEKRSHYALLCQSDVSIEEQSNAGIFDAIYAKNLASLNPIGASQVTSVVSYQPKVRLSKGPLTFEKPYQVAFRAKFFGKGFVRLARPVVMTGTMMALYQGLCEVQTAKEWHEGVQAIRSIAEDAVGGASCQNDLFGEYA
ncbi:hypothetical protein EDC30_103198 [Paucimonas lemoignei]|uniref:Uncharacterized protein n=1 Tax=Paucimonas lemoignei TaxID=29443 RepID=A0A4R3HX78_PAULE|nr:hypothetical protein [Paucimonas lemoignei]TCS37906.1 hypothetical protein EDC30_103198 [Paucimonas lemoignei]